MGALAAEEVRCLRPWLPTVTTPLHAVAGALAEEEVVLEAVAAYCYNPATCCCGRTG
jgi:hypothetical protein